MSSSLLKANQFKDDMKREFEMNDGVMKYFLGLEIKQDKAGIHMSQRKYLEDLLKISHMQGCKLVSVPMTPETKLQVFGKSEEANITVYRSLIGKLLHLTHLRPDIMFVVNLLSRFMSKTTRIQFTTEKCILRYLAGTLD